MKYNCTLQKDVDAAVEYLTKLVASEAIVEVKRIFPTRSLNQNSYLHLLIAAFGSHFGYTMEEAKLIYKEINREIYNYEKKGRTFIRSSSDLNTEEMAKTIDRFMQKSAEADYALPLATNQEWLMQLANEIEASNYYL